MFQLTVEIVLAIYVVSIPVGVCLMIWGVKHACESPSEDACVYHLDDYRPDDEWPERAA